MGDKTSVIKEFILEMSSKHNVWIGSIDLTYDKKTNQIIAWQNFSADDVKELDRFDVIE